MLKAVLFDMDDTLLDWSQRSLDWHDHEREHLKRVFDFVSREVHPLNGSPELFYETVRQYSRQSWLEAERGLRAPSYPEALRNGLERIGVPPDLIDIERCLRVYDWQLIAGVTVFPDVPEVLDKLVAQGLKIGLVTNSSVPMWLRDNELERCGLLKYFVDCRFSAVDVGFIKPHPVIFETALNCLEVHPGEAVFVGDNPEADIIGAQRVGMKAVLRILDHRPPVLTSHEIAPNGIIETFHDLPPLLDEWYPGWRQ